MEKKPHRRPICVRRKHREPASSFDSDPEEVLYQKSNSVEVDMSKRRSICVRRKHREPSATFSGSDVEEDTALRRDSVKVELPARENPQEEGSACETDHIKKGIKRKFQTNEECGHGKEEKVGVECFVGMSEDTVEDDSEEFDFDEWVEKQKRIIRDISGN